MVALAHEIAKVILTTEGCEWVSVDSSKKDTLGKPGWGILEFHVSHNIYL